MSTKKENRPEIEEIDPESLLEDQKGTQLLLSFQDSEEGSCQFPSMNSRNENSSVFDKSKIDHDDFEDEVVEIRRSSYALQEDSVNSDSNSFSVCNSSIREQELMKSKVLSKLKTTKQAQKCEYSPSEQKQMMKMFNQSIFSQKTKKNQLTPKKESKTSEEETNLIDYGKSFYMSDPHPITVPEIKLKKSDPKEKKVVVNFISKDYFLQIKEYSVAVDYSSLQDLYNEFFKKQIFVPVFNPERFEEWARSKDSNKYSLQCEAHMNFKIYLERYVEYLNSFCPKDFEQAIKNIQMIQQGKSEKKMPNQPSFSLFNLDFSSLLQNFNFLLNSPKTIILRRTLLAKIRSLHAILKQKQKWEITPDQVHSINKTIQSSWKDLASVELLSSFEQTQELCNKKIEKSTELKFKETWLHYRDANRKEKLKFMNEVQIIGL